MWSFQSTFTVELDLEQGPHVRVVQGKEPLAFIRLFNGRMVIYKGLREEEEPSDASMFVPFINLLFQGDPTS